MIVDRVLVTRLDLRYPLFYFSSEVRLRFASFVLLLLLTNKSGRNFSNTRMDIFTRGFFETLVNLNASKRCPRDKSALSSSSSFSLFSDLESVFSFSSSSDDDDDDDDDDVGASFISPQRNALEHTTTTEQQSYFFFTFAKTSTARRSWCYVLSPPLAREIYAFVVVLLLLLLLLRVVMCVISLQIQLNPERYANPKLFKP